MKIWPLLGAAALAATAAPVSADGETQAARGAALYAGRCAACHDARMEGLDVSPALRPPAFLSEWQGRPLSDLTRRIRSTMPQDAPGSLDAAQTAAVTAAILKTNALSYGAADVPESSAGQKLVTIGR